MMNHNHPQAVILLSVLLCIVGALNTASGQCADRDQLCDVIPGSDGITCCKGFCWPIFEDPEGKGTCSCSPDGIGNLCRTNSFCCNELCNSNGFCGCIGYLSTCTNSDECYERNGVKSCVSICDAINPHLLGCGVKVCN